MFTKMVTVMVIVGLVFGGAVATASAAQESLPKDALYPLKTLSERIELGLTAGSQAKLEKALEHVQRRVEEMAALSEMGEAVPQHLAEGYSEQVEYALQVASRLPDAELKQALERIQAALLGQMGIVEQLQAARPEDTQLSGVSERLQAYLGLVVLGLNNPQTFGESLAVFFQTGGGMSPSFSDDPSVTETPAPGDDVSNTNDDANANTNDDSNTNTNDDSNANDDDSNTNSDDDSNGNTNDDSNANDDDSNTNSDDDSNANTNDDSNANDDDSNTNSNDDSNANTNDDNNANTNDDSNANTNDDDSNTNSDDDSNSNDDDSNGALLDSFFAFIAWVGSAMRSV